MPRRKRNRVRSEGDSSSSLHAFLVLMWICSLLVAFHLGKVSSSSFSGHRLCSSSVSESPTSTATKNDDDDNKNDKTKKKDDGWHSVDVFFGKREQLDSITPPEWNRRSPNPTQDWFGQAGQDRFVYQLLNNRKNGFFLDLASNDARTLSNTFALERYHNWTGICMEPNPVYWHDLSYRDHCHVVGAVVGKHRMEEIDFELFASKQSGTGGGIVKAGFDNTADGQSQNQMESFRTKKYTVPLLEVLERYNAPSAIDYLSLDVEGAEGYIMEDFPFHKYQFSLMSVERPKDDLVELLKQQNYTLLATITQWGETIWAHGSIRDSLDVSLLPKH